MQLVISDHHLGLKNAIASVFVGAAWQRCRVHFMRNVLSKVPKASAEMVAAAVRTVFAQPDRTHVHRQLDEVVRMLESKFPEVASMLTDAAEDLLAFASFPQAHWRKIWSTNPLERLNGEIKRRTNVVGIFPNDAAVSRLVNCGRRRVPRRVGDRGAPLPVRRVDGQARRTTGHSRGQRR